MNWPLVGETVVSVISSAQGPGSMGSGLSNRPEAALGLCFFFEAQPLVLALEHAAYGCAVGWLLLESFRVPLAASPVEKVAPVNVNPAGETQQGIRNRMNGVFGQHRRIFFKKGRITSYNVCYTKLLRVETTNYGSMSLRFRDCDTGTISYDLPSLDIKGFV